MQCLQRFYYVMHQYKFHQAIMFGDNFVYFHACFYAPAINWRKGIYVEFTLSVCVCVCVYLCTPDLCPTHNFIVHSGI